MLARDVLLLAPTCPLLSLLLELREPDEDEEEEEEEEEEEDPDENIDTRISERSRFCFLAFSSSMRYCRASVLYFVCTRV